MMNDRNQFHLRISPEPPRKSSILGFVPEVPNLPAKCISNFEMIPSKLDTLPPALVQFAKSNCALGVLARFEYQSRIAAPATVNRRTQIKTRTLSVEQDFASVRAGFEEVSMKKYVVLLAFFAYAAVCHAQGLGSIVGRVTDPSGAAMASAKVTVTQEGTGLSRGAASDPDGLFVTPSLPPASYIMIVEAPGFSIARQTGITLLADQTLTVNMTVKLGSTTEILTVTADQVQVDTSTSTLKQVIEQERIIELPLNGRNAAELTLLVPGAVSAPSGGAQQGSTKTFPGAVTFSANGARQNSISYQLDGGNYVDEYTNVNQPFPFPDALQEFSVQTSNYSAEYGQNAGGVVNVVTKSGTNDFHGDAFEFNRNAVFNARNFFAATRDPLKRNQFGGTVGGPVRLPGYNGRDKTFFFVGYQGTRISTFQGGLSSFVPTAANLNGDFSNVLTANPSNPLGK